VSASGARFRAMVEGKLPPPPVADLVGIELTTMERGRATFHLDARPEHASPLGTVQGGIICVLVDAAMGAAYVSLLEDDETFATLELKTNYLKPVWTGRMTAVAEVVKAGRTIGLVECRVTDEGGSLVAHSTSTCMTLRGEQAAGR
jgi:uncharacterized protein (TIGR00369 family)